MHVVKKMTLQLISPYGGKPAVFNFPMDSKIPVSCGYSLHYCGLDIRIKKKISKGRTEWNPSNNDVFQRRRQRC